jgi:hypothetical protein
MLRVTGTTATSLAGDERGTRLGRPRGPPLARSGAPSQVRQAARELEARPPRVFASRARERRDPVTLENELSHLPRTGRRTMREERAERNPRLGASDDISGGCDGLGAESRPPSVAPPSPALPPCPPDVQTEARGDADEGDRQAQRQAGHPHEQDELGAAAPIRSRRVGVRQSDATARLRPILTTPTTGPVSARGGVARSLEPDGG